MEIIPPTSPPRKSRDDPAFEFNSNPRYVQEAKQIRDQAAELDELKGAGLVESYVEGKEFWHIAGWHRQKIDKPTYIPSAGTGIRRGLDEDSTSPRRVRASGVESKGMESKDICSETDQPSPPPSVTSHDSAVLEFTCDGKTKTWRFTAQIKDRENVVVIANIALSYIASSNGVYRGTITKAQTATLVDGNKYFVEMTAVVTGFEDGFRRFELRAKYHGRQ